MPENEAAIQRQFEMYIISGRVTNNKTIKNKKTTEDCSGQLGALAVSCTIGAGKRRVIDAHYPGDT
jgi:hypothetical protein